MGMMNRLANAKNHHQGDRKRVLCVCSAGLLRSPTAAFVLSQEPYGFNTRAAGAEDDFALIAVDEVLIEWAEEIVFMQERHYDIVAEQYEDAMEGKVCRVLKVPDIYPYRHPELMEAIKEQYDESVVFRSPGVGDTDG